MPTTSTSFVDITDHGARPGGKCTQAIAAAIERVASTGGTVYVPPGRYETGMIVLKSGVTLHVDPAAVLVGSGDIADYPRNPVANTHEHDHHFLVYAEDAQDITLTGGGVIDGNGPAFWDEPAPGRQWWRARSPRVIPMIELRRCRRVRLENIRIANSPGWTVHPYCCDDVTFRGVRVDNHMFGPNTDGFDIDGCRDVFISDCHLRCGDDAIILKATPKARSTERVVITNCICHSNCIGIGIGQETESDVRQVSVSNCTIYNSHRMFTIGIWNGGTVEDVTVSNLVGDTLDCFYLARPIQMEIKQHLKLPPRPLGAIRNVNISNIIARTQGRILLTAQDGSFIDNLTLRDIRLQYAALEDAAALSPPDGETGSTQYANRNLEARRQNAAVVLENVRNLDMEGLRIHWPEPGAPSRCHGAPADSGPDGGGAADPPYGVLWARRVLNSRIHAPNCTATVEDHPAAVVQESAGSDIRVGP